MNISDLSTCYAVRALLPEDAERVLPLLRGNEIFYHYHPPEPTLASICEDMAALPPGKTLRDKHYAGFFQGDALIAVMDLILDYPSPGTAMIGFFMVDIGRQGRGVGTQIIAQALEVLAAQGMTKVRLAIDEGNPQSRAFWLKNGFALTGERIPNAHSAYLPMEKLLSRENNCRRRAFTA